MLIEFERSGGFAGMRMTASIDTDDLPAEQAEEIGRLIEESGFFTLPESPEQPSPGADRFQYVVRVESEGVEHTIRTGEAGASEPLKALFRQLTLLARGGGKDPPHE